jgi:hypothetical protein
MSGDHNMYQKPRSYDDDTQYDESQVQAMIRKAVRDEREACAKICETFGVNPALNIWNGGPDWYKHGKDCAAAIRAREKQ